jgi:rhodanese-related sulfurtransferase
MRKLGPLLSLGVLAGIVALAACSEHARESAELVPPGELAALLERQDAPLLLDVRTPEEFASGHVPGATLLPLQELEARAGALAAYRERGVVTYCEVGGRAAQAARLLRANGFANVRLLEGSMQRWRADGREIESGGP